MLRSGLCLPVGGRLCSTPVTTCYYLGELFAVPRDNSKSRSEVRPLYSLGVPPVNENHDWDHKDGHLAEKSGYQRGPQLPIFKAERHAAVPMVFLSAVSAGGNRWRGKNLTVMGPRGFEPPAYGFVDRGATLEM